MIFLILTPPYPPPPLLGTLLGGGGGQNFFAYCGRRACIWTWVLRNFFLVYGPPNPCGGTRVPTSGIPPLASEDGLTLGGLFSDT